MNSTTSPAALAHRPDQHTHQQWFTNIAAQLLNHTALVIDETRCRIREVEFYYRDDHHPDPFTHQDNHQLTCAQWYFHRKGGSYRGGSFKGLDISFGPSQAYGGILIRTIETTTGDVINGCSLCVDHILKQTGHDTIAALDAHLLGHQVADTTLPLHLEPWTWDAQAIVSTARVGLTLKRAEQHPAMPAFLMSPYRFLTDPTIKKGKIYTIMALHQQGAPIEEIVEMTRSPKKSITTYIQRYDEGSQVADSTSFHGKSLKTADIAELHGVLQDAIFEEA